MVTREYTKQMRLVVMGETLPSYAHFSFIPIGAKVIDKEIKKITEQTDKQNKEFLISR